MAPPKKPTSTSGSFDPARMIDDLINEGMSRMNIRLDIIEFAEQILGVNLMVPQKAILKAFYNLPLDADELAWLNQMVLENKTTWRPGVIYTELDVEAGMRSTKTFLASIGVTYEFYELIGHDDPAVFYGLAKGSPIFITTVATTQQQSKDTVFGYTTARITESPYFQTMRDKGLIVIKDERIECPGKRVTIIGGHSNQAGMVGKTAKLFCMDEAARFKDASTGQSNARSMYANVGRSTTTFKKNGRKFIISSAWEDGDIMEWLWDQADPDIPGQDMLAFRLCTWDINTGLTRTDFDKEYRQDETAARRDYEGIRPGTVENFFNKQIIQQAVTGRSVAVVNKVTLEVSGSDDSNRRYVGLMLSQLEKIKFGEYSYAHCDPGLKKDSFSMVVGHGVRTDSGMMAVIDLILEWEPKDQGKGLVHQVSYENVEEIIRQVHAARNLRRICFDHWNSGQIIQRLYARGIVSEEIFFSGGKQMALYQTARQKLNAGLVVLPDNCPKVVKELIHIQLLRGSKIDHPRKNPDETPGTKDLADALVSVCAQIADDERGMLFGANTGKAQPIRMIGKTHVAGLMGKEGRHSMNVMHQSQRGGY